MNLSYGGEITFTAGRAIPLTTHDGNLIPKNAVYAHIKESFLQNAEIYNDSCIIRLMIRVYMEQKREDRPELSVSDRYRELFSTKEEELSEIEPIPASEIRKLQHKKRNYPEYITALKSGSKEMKAFMV